MSSLNRLCRGSLGGWFKRDQFDWFGCNDVLPTLFGNTFKTSLTVQLITQRTGSGDDPSSLMQTLSVDQNSIVCFDQNLQRLAVSAILSSPSSGGTLPFQTAHGVRPVGGGVSFARTDTSASHPGWIDYNPFESTPPNDGLPENGGSSGLRAFSFSGGALLSGPTDQPAGLSYTFRTSFRVYNKDILAGDEPKGLILHDAFLQTVGQEATIGALHWGLGWNEALLENTAFAANSSVLQADIVISILQV